MAAEKPVVGTALPELVAMYGDVVRIGHDSLSFLDACRWALSESPLRRGRAGRRDAGDRGAPIRGTKPRRALRDAPRAAARRDVAAAPTRRRAGAHRARIPCVPPLHARAG
jgi:hypothetical protein